MTYKIYAIYDRAADFLKKPFVCDHDTDAIRAFLTMADNFVHNPASAGDYCLVSLGQYNTNLLHTDIEGEFVEYSASSPVGFVQIASGAQLVRRATELRDEGFVDENL